MALSSNIAAALAVLVVVLAASSRVAEGQADCASKLVPCAAYLNSTTPSAECCSSIKEVVTTQLECLCRLYANPGLLPGINMTQALMIPKYCNLSTDTNACKTALSPRSSPPAPPAPVPAKLSYFHGGDIGLQVVGQKSLVYVDGHNALEVVHRTEIKQNYVPFDGDLDNIFPKWATQKENEKENNSCKISVDVGFRYLIRLHFSQLGLKIAGTGDVMFKVFINEMIAHTNIDIIEGR
ncbi:hypothetical protein MIMGU_mgv11b0165481mg, partial [Erythranthe guttata]